MSGWSQRDSISIDEYLKVFFHENIVLDENAYGIRSNFQGARSAFCMY